MTFEDALNEIKDSCLFSIEFICNTEDEYKMNIQSSVYESMRCLSVQHMHVLHIIYWDFIAMHCLCYKPCIVYNGAEVLIDCFACHFCKQYCVRCPIVWPNRSNNRPCIYPESPYRKWINNITFDCTSDTYNAIKVRDITWKYEED